jgi:hypothetical protein
MWVFRNDAFVSAVQDRKDAGHLWVRGRVAGDVERFMGWRTGDRRVAVTPEGDYLYRARVGREAFTEALICAVDEVTYDNFKGSIAPTKKGNRRHDAYLRVWGVLVDYQTQLVKRSHYWRLK